MRTLAEIAVGLLFGVGAIFNAAYTLRHGEEFFGDFVARAWLPPARRLVTELLLPRATVFTSVLIAFQAAIALALLSGGALVVPGLVAGGTFALTIALFSSPGGAVANLALAVLQFSLALTH